MDFYSCRVLLLDCPYQGKIEHILRSNHYPAEIIAWGPDYRALVFRRTDEFQDGMRVYRYIMEGD